MRLFATRRVSSPPVFDAWPHGHPRECRLKRGPGPATGRLFGELHRAGGLTGRMASHVEHSYVAMWPKLQDTSKIRWNMVETLRRTFTFFGWDGHW